MTKKKVILAYSGGLDTSYCALYLSKECDLEVHAVSVNTGGFTQDEIQQMEIKAMELGAATYKCIHAQQDYYESIVKYLIYGNVLRNNTYPLSVSAERVVQAMKIVEYAKANGADYIAHGSTGAGNDQVRFDMIFQIMAPDIEIITPIRDEQLSRDHEIAYLQSNGIQGDWQKAKYSINQGLWGTSVGGAETLTSHLDLPSEAYPSQLSQDERRDLTIDFHKGEIVAIDGQKGDPISLIGQLNEIASKYAIGRDIHVGDTIIGIKGRVGFEAGGPMIIIKAHHLLEKHVLSKWQLYQKEQMANFYGMMIHEGHYLDPVIRDIEAYLSSSQDKVTGKAHVALSPYQYHLKGIESPHDLMNASFGAYGEENKAWTADDAKGFIKILSNAGKIYHHVNHQQ